jgi:hypothetical protein
MQDAFGKTVTGNAPAIPARRADEIRRWVINADFRGQKNN